MKTKKRAKEKKKVKTANRKWHNIEAGFYDRLRTEIWNRFEQERIRSDIGEIKQKIAKGKVLDIGCGTGNLALKFLRRGYEVKGVDISEKMLAGLREKVKVEGKRRLELIRAEVNQFLGEDDNKYNIIAFSSVLHHLPNYFETLRKAISRLKEPGIIYIVHEPLPAKVSNHRPKWLSVMDRVLTSHRYLYQLIFEVPEKENPKVDFHLDEKNGINLGELRDFLKSKDIEVIKISPYTVWKSSVVAALDNKFELSTCTDFRLIGEK